MNDKLKVFAKPRGYNINKEDIENMMKSGLPDETVEATFMLHPGVKKMGWLIEVVRKIYGEEFVSHSFVTLGLVTEGPDWIDEQHRIIDKAFEAARQEHPKAMH